MGMLDDLLGAALGQDAGTQAQGGQAGPSGLPAGLGAGSLAALLPVVLQMLNQGQSQGGGGGLGGLLGQMLGGGAGGGSGAGAGLAGGLGGLLQQVEQAGFGDHARSWVGTGQNLPIPPDAIGKIFGQGGLADIARQAGISPDDASAGLAHLLPAVVDHMTPQGSMPAQGDLAGTLAGLLQKLGG